MPEIRVASLVALGAWTPPEPFTAMWPVQTLTLLLCLTDEEQLYARIEPQPAVIEVAAPTAQPATEALALDVSTIMAQV